ncbi:hypothetical protein KEM56_000582 [Ascosphaera pollenicola]|nr:hypothetical protein KEM56_000582 [Ascosphaera pollenicola]
MHPTFVQQGLPERLPFSSFENPQTTLNYQQPDLMDICPKTPAETNGTPSANDVSCFELKVHLPVSLQFYTSEEVTHIKSCELEK